MEGRREEKRDVMLRRDDEKRGRERWKRKKRFVNESLRKTGARPGWMVSALGLLATRVRLRLVTFHFTCLHWIETFKPARDGAGCEVVK